MEPTLENILKTLNDGKETVYANNKSWSEDEIVQIAECWKQAKQLNYCWMDIKSMRLAQTW